MLPDENYAFEIKENELDFNQICSQLKNHSFSSPWEIFFKSTCDEEFSTEVSEIILDNVVMKNDSSAQLIKITDDISYDIIEMDFNISRDIPFDEKKVSRLKEILITTEDCSAVDHIKDIDIFFTIPSSQIPMLFKILEVIIFNETAIILLLNIFLHFKDKISIAVATALVSYIINPFILKEKKNFSRSFIATILKFSEVHPKAIIDEIMIPFVKDTTGDLQPEFIFQISKFHLPNGYISYCIKSILEHASSTENTFALLQSIIERKCHLEREFHNLLLKKLLSWTSMCNKNIKFTKLLTNVLSVYGSEFNEQQILLCDELVKDNKTIIKKAAENILKKLKRQD